ncbi:MAG TPA: XdhC/CoxI family protein [Hyphomicrobiaceae bacterium]|nr:XdhC/CoxI family protein [Hyphomicrobiaceae bacterium]
MQQPIDVLDAVKAMKAAGEPFALATVVRTVAVTAAKAGAKALIRRDGSVTAGWIGGGCALAAVVKAARAALSDGRPRLISVQPTDALADLGVVSGQSRAGVEFASNLCPSQGSMDIFIEPVLPKPELLICGASPVAIALAALGKALGFSIAIAAAPGQSVEAAAADRVVDGYDLSGLPAAERYIVVATQGRGDEAALAAALSIGARHVAFVGSRRKAAALRQRLAAKAVDAERLAAVRCPAGLDIGAVTPEEIALSILSEIVACRRRGHRLAAETPDMLTEAGTTEAEETPHGHER